MGFSQMSRSEGGEYTHTDVLCPFQGRGKPEDVEENTEDLS